MTISLVTKEDLERWRAMKGPSYGGPIMTKQEMYEAYPRKWLLINNPETSDENAEILSAELLGVYDDRPSAYADSYNFELVSYSIISSLQEE